jgi:glycosyltransferase involved in cell wall biosynthesis
MNDPLVSIGLPCYNRAAQLGRAIESALGQDYPNLELIVSDNASTDDTEAICRNWASRDERVRYFRQPENLGGIANFDFVRDHAQGEYFLWLGDDDWIDENYVSSCVATLQEHLDYVAAYGRAIYYQNGEVLWDRPGFSLLQDDAGQRVTAYYKLVDDNGLLYGVFRRAALQRAGAFRRMVAGDWMHMAAVAFQGKIAVVDQTRMHRALGGTSESYQKILASFGLPAFYVRIFMLRAGLEAWRDIMRQPVYNSLGFSRRVLLALRVQPSFWRRHVWVTLMRYKTFAYQLSLSPSTRPLYEAMRKSYRLVRRVRHRIFGRS